MCGDDTPLKVCSKCGKAKEETVANFPRQYWRGRCTGLRAECRDCYKLRAARWRQAHPDALAAKRQTDSYKRSQQAYNRSHREEIAARNSAWKKRHPEACAASVRNRRSRSGSTHTAADVAAQRARQNGLCYWCGEKVEVGRGYHVDHVVPLVLGGSNGPENLVIACAACNLSKGAKHPMDFAGQLF